MGCACEWVSWVLADPRRQRAAVHVAVERLPCPSPSLPQLNSVQACSGLGFRALGGRQVQLKATLFELLRSPQREAEQNLSSPG